MKIKQMAVLVIALGIVGVTLNHCSKAIPIGNDYDIHVLADSSIWQETQPLLAEIFEKIEPTPQPEKLFTLYLAEPTNYKRYKNLLFLATLDSEDEISQAVKNGLSPEALQKVKEGEFMFVSDNTYAQTQKIMYLVAPDLTSLKENISQNQDEIFDQFENFWRDFHREILYRLDEQKDVEKHLLNRYGWMIRVPIDYKMEIQSARDKFVMFHRKLPLRWISVFWEEATNPSIITKEYAIAKRDHWAESFYEQEYVDDKWEPVRTEEVDFLGRRALMLKGLWSRPDSLGGGGGPFWMYSFFDEKTERIYFIDMHMFAPDLKKKKIHYLRQMDIIAHTFKTKLEVNPDEL